MLNTGCNWFLLAQASQTASDAAKAGTEPAGIAGWLLFLIILAIFILPFVFGSLLGRWLKLKDLSTKMGTILLVVTLGLTPFASQAVKGKVEKSQYKDVLAEWEKKQQRFRITDKGVEEFKQALPNCEVLQKRVPEKRSP